MKRKQKNVLIRKNSHVEFCPNSTDDETKEWEEGIVLSIQGRGRSRKYSIRSLKKSDLQVFRFPWQVRPVPPEAYLVSPAVGNVVEAFDVSHQCWRRGVITDILLTNPDYLIVYHEYINGHYLHHRSDLRQALQWRDNSWSLVPNASLPERCFQGETSVGSCPAPFDLETDAQTEGSKESETRVEEREAEEICLRSDDLKKCSKSDNFKNLSNPNETKNRVKSDEIQSHVEEVTEAMDGSETILGKRKNLNEFHENAKRTKHIKKSDEQEGKQKKEPERYGHFLKPFLSCVVRAFHCISKRL